MLLRITLSVLHVLAALISVIISYYAKSILIPDALIYYVSFPLLFLIPFLSIISFLSFKQFKLVKPNKNSVLLYFFVALSCMLFRGYIDFFIHQFN